MRGVPVQFRIGIAFFMTLLTFLSMDAQAVEMDALYMMLIIREILIGILLGFVAYLFFTVRR